MAWVLRGLREGIVTTRYPKRADGYGASFKGAVSVTGDRPQAAVRSARAEPTVPADEPQQLPIPAAAASKQS